MRIRKIIHNKKQYFDLLLQAEEQEDMIAMYVLTGESTPNAW